MINGTFIEHLHESIIHNMRAYWGSHKRATLEESVREATLVRNLQSGSSSPETTLSPTQTKGRRDRRRDRSNRNIMETDSATTNIMNNSKTNSDRVMAINIGSTVTPPEPTQTTAISTTMSSVTGDRCGSRLCGYYCAKTCPILPRGVRMKLVDERLQKIKTMPPRRQFYRP